MMLSKLLFCSCPRSWGNVAPTLVRLAAGIIFAAHGYQRLYGGVEGFAGFLASLGVPAAPFFGWFVTLLEFFGGIALVLGVLTRLASVLLAIDMLSAFFLVHADKGIFVSDGGFELVLLLFAASLSLAMTGAGALSLDNLWCKKRKEEASRASSPADEPPAVSAPTAR